MVKEHQVRGQSNVIYYAMTDLHRHEIYKLKFHKKFNKRVTTERIYSLNSAVTAIQCDVEPVPLHKIRKH